MKFLNLLLLVFVFSVNAFADIRLPDTPKPTPSPETTADNNISMNIVIVSDLPNARLAISRNSLEKLLAENSKPTATTALYFSKAQTVVGGLFLSLAFVFGGVWFTQFKKLNSPAMKSASIGVLLFLSGAFMTATLANVAPPPLAARSITSRLFDKEVMRRRRAFGTVKLEIVDGNNSATLYVPEVSEKTKSDEE